uniref:Uncharacterized protein n=1 Tax=Romanomermis culicivorax TaxID=13658 RepID=A0A915KQN7_ROMCU
MKRIQDFQSSESGIQYSRRIEIVEESGRSKKRDMNVVGQSVTVEETKQSEKSYKTTTQFLAFRIMSNNRNSRRIEIVGESTHNQIRFKKPIISVFCDRVVGLVVKEWMLLIF